MAHDQLLLSHRFRVYFGMQLPGLAIKPGTAPLSILGPLTRLPIYGSLDMRFQRVSGMSRELSVTELRPGGENVGTIHLPDRVSHHPIVLERGIMTKVHDSIMTLMFESGLGYFLNGYADMIIVLMDSRDRPSCMWYVRDAMPTRWQLGDLDAASNTVLIETMEFSYQSIKRIPVKL